MRSCVDLYVKVAEGTLLNRFAHAGHADHLTVADARRNHDRDLFLSAEHSLAPASLTGFFRYFSCPAASITNSGTGDGAQNSSFHLVDFSLAVTLLTSFHFRA